MSARRLLRRLVAAAVAAIAAGFPVTASPREGSVAIRSWKDVLGGRSIRVYVPPDYATSGERYPVLYLFDGQNLFDAATSFAGEWFVDEICNEGIAAGRIEPLIVVGIDNGRTERLFEYTPWPGGDTGDAGGGGGAEHLAEIVRTLKPRIDREYRTRPDGADTGIGGSSLGGLMTLYAAMEWPRVFGRFAALSPSLHWADRRTRREFERRRPLDVRLYVDMGGLEQRRAVDRDDNGVDDSLDDLRDLGRVLEQRILLPEERLLIVEDAKGIHNEAAWARRLPGALEFLFPGMTPRP